MFNPSWVDSKEDYKITEHFKKSNVSETKRLQFETFVKSACFKEVYGHFLEKAILYQPSVGVGENAMAKAYAYYNQQSGIRQVFNYLLTTARVKPEDIGFVGPQLNV